MRQGRANDSNEGALRIVNWLGIPHRLTQLKRMVRPLASTFFGSYTVCVLADRWAMNIATNAPAMATNAAIYGK